MVEGTDLGGFDNRTAINFVHLAMLGAVHLE
jgi:hypothetical protein